MDEGAAGNVCVPIESVRYWAPLTGESNGRLLKTESNLIESEACFDTHPPLSL